MSNQCLASLAMTSQKIKLHLNLNPRLLFHIYTWLMVSEISQALIIFIFIKQALFLELELLTAATAA